MGTRYKLRKRKHRTGKYAGCEKTCLGVIADGLGVSYNMDANDLEGVN